MRREQVLVILKCLEFSWSASANTSTYDLKIINLEANTVINKNGLTTTNTTVALNKGSLFLADYTQNVRRLKQQRVIHGSSI